MKRAATARLLAARGGVGVRELITARRLRRLIRYSPRTGTFRWLFSRSPLAKKGCRAGNESRGGYLKIFIDRRQYSAGRLAWLYVHGSLPAQCVSYRDGNPRNRRLANLRLGARSQILAHSKLRIDNAAGAKGVCLERTTRRWVANINKDGRRHYLGLFDTKAQAQAAYIKAALKLHGEFARSH